MKIGKTELIIMLALTFVDLIFFVVFFAIEEPYMNTSVEKKSVNAAFEIQNSTENPDSESELINATGQVKMKDDYSGTRDFAMEEIFQKQIIGNYIINDTMEYNFGMNGLYYGFFDNINQNVEGYYYQIVVVDEVPILNIYNKERTTMVTYELILNDSYKVVLYYPDADIKIKLE